MYAQNQTLLAPPVVRSDLSDIQSWMESFSQSVRDQDYDAGRALFAPDVFAFGSRVEFASGIDQLHHNQWSHIWSQTRGYRFDFDQLHGGANGNIAWGAAPWRSEGKAKDNTWFPRQGRATFILERRRGIWLAVHSHHSLNP